MKPFKYRIFVCIRERPLGKEACAGNGALETVQLLKKEIAKRGLAAELKVNIPSYGGTGYIVVTTEPNG